MKLESTKERPHQPTESTKEHRHQKTDRTSKLIIGVVAAIFLVATPFLFYAYRLIPTTLEETTFLGMTIKAGAHGNLNYYAYYLFTKTVIAIAFSIWYLTCRYWWRWAILVPICMKLFQILGVINTSVDYIDEFDFWYSLPVVIPILAILVLMAKKLRFYAIAMDLHDQINTEIENHTL